MNEDIIMEDFLKIFKLITKLIIFVVLCMSVLPWFGKEIKKYNKQQYAYKTCKKYNDLQKLRKCHEMMQVDRLSRGTSPMIHSGIQD